MTRSSLIGWCQSKENCDSLIRYSGILRLIIRFQFQSFLFQQLGKTSNFHIILLGQRYFVDFINYNLDNEDQESREPIIASTYRFNLET